MAAQQGIKQRIKSVTNTKQITKAMQLVAASKLRKAQEAALGPKDYIAVGTKMLEKLSSASEAQYHPFFAKRNGKKALIIAISSDRGLAGAYNSNVLRAIAKYTLDSGVDQSVIGIGKYIAQHVARTTQLNEVLAYMTDTENPDVAIIQPVLSEAIDQFVSGKVDSVQLISTTFTSIVKQDVLVTQLLPIAPPAVPVSSNTTYEPEVDQLLDFVLKRLLEAQLMQALLEAKAAEQAARMLAMKNATDNASDLIADLTLAYNNARQAAITQELAEITAGAEAANG